MEQQATFKPRIKRLGATRFLVESKSKPGVGHQVDTLRLHCTCPAGQHGRRCWHLVWALQAEQWYARAEAQAKAATRPAMATAAPAAPSPVSFHESAGYKALAECFG